MNLRYTKRAAIELDAVLTHLELASPQGASRVKKRLQDAIDLLLRYPLAGRLTDKRRLRRVTAFPYPYVIYYRADPTGITIHGIRHTARKPFVSTTS